MQLFNLHRKSIYVLYQNRLCSLSTLTTALVVLLSLILPYCVISLINPGALWDRYRLVYEQPKVHFDYQYLFLAEIDRPDDTNRLITCSSFQSYNELTDHSQECNAIKVMADDGNMDGKIDKLSASVAFNLPDESAGMAFYTFYFFLDAEVKSNCHFTIPAMISLSKQTPPTQPFTSGRISHLGHLRASQSVALQCPFFMRNIKTHFNHNYRPNENYTSVEEFLPESILHRIEHSNAAYFAFEQTRTQWSREGSGDVEIQVQLLIGGEDGQKTALLYNASLWQKVAQFWAQYFSVLIVFLWMADKLKDWMFDSYWIRAMRVVPWKEKVV
ncbi:AAEL015276-PA [Aedes aegypti]|uniref:Transmembrane protein 231 n=1 Tax=Aedes aegypti TaxID=7159 RepID=Q1DH29_AEDAE|nr:AAEL015276-PA [Aedes aegypti]